MRLRFKTPARRLTLRWYVLQICSVDLTLILELVWSDDNSHNTSLFGPDWRCDKSGTLCGVNTPAPKLSHVLYRNYYEEQHAFSSLLGSRPIEA